MIELRVVPNKPPLSGYSAVTEPRHELLGLWLDGDVRTGGGDYDIEFLWSEISQHLAGEIPEVQQTSDVFTIRVQQRVATLFGGVVGARMKWPIELSLTLDDFADTTERWFDVVDPSIAASLRRIRAGWLK
jgi:hypothetical protein